MNDTDTLNIDNTEVVHNNEIQKHIKIKQQWHMEHTTVVPIVLHQMVSCCRTYTEADSLKGVIR
jgi:hypothetical protein